MSFNQVNLLGRIGKIETKYLPSGSAVTNLSIATSERWMNKQTNQYEEKTEWTNCVSFGKQAETIAQYFQKGSEIFISGKLQTRSWEDNNGQKRYATDVLINTFSFTGGSRTDGQQTTQQQGRPHQPPQQKGNSFDSHNDFDSFDSDIPF